jgi:hypothetical protein
VALAAVAAVVLGSLGWMLLLAGGMPAGAEVTHGSVNGAVGNTGLAKLIISNPVPGWVHEPRTSLARIDTYLNSLEVDSIVPNGGNALNAVQGWRDPKDSSHYVIIALVALRFNGYSASQVVSHTRAGVVDALASLCSSGATASSVHAGVVEHIAGSHALTCTVHGQGGVVTQPFAAGWGKSNVMALVLSVQSAVSAPAMTLIAGAQNTALPAAGYTVAVPAGSDTGTIIEVIVGLLVLAAVVWAIWKVRQRYRRTTATATATARPGRLARAAAVTVEPVVAPKVRKGTVNRPASKAGGVPGPSSSRSRPRL